MNIESIIRQKQGTVVDVRTRGEFQSGHVAGSVNIPLQEIHQRLNDVKDLKQPLILCCASGGRSSQANIFLSREGIECYNAGSWMDVDYYYTQSE